PGLARDLAALAVGPLRDDLVQMGEDATRLPAGAEGNVERVHAQVPEAAVLPVHLDHPLPVDRLVGIEVARMHEAAVHFDDAAEAVLLDRLDDPLRTGRERELRRAAD